MNKKYNAVKDNSFKLRYINVSSKSFSQMYGNRVRQLNVFIFHLSLIAAHQTNV
jgi:hypothetical protein